MDQRTHDKLGVNTAQSTGGDMPGNEHVRNPELPWIIGFLFVVSFIGVFSIVALRKVLSSFCYRLLALQPVLIQK